MNPDPLYVDEGAVWRQLEADPAFVAGMARAAEDYQAGRFAPFRHRTPRPQPHGAGMVNTALVFVTWGLTVAAVVLVVLTLWRNRK